MIYTKEQLEQYLQDLYEARQKNPGAYINIVWERAEKQLKDYLAKL